MKYWIETSNLEVTANNIPILKSITLQVPEGKSLALLGESGSGKSTFAKAILGLLNPELGYKVKGEVKILERNVYSLPYIQRIKLYWRWFSFLYQDAISMFDPLRPVGIQILEALKSLNITNEPENYIMQMFQKVRLEPAERVFKNYPYELSGGMLKRCAIVYTLISEPDILVLDEITTGLDKDTTEIVLNAFNEVLRKKHLILISHNLKLIEDLVDWVAVFYRGFVIEFGELEKIYSSPQHPYTSLLMDILKNRTITYENFKKKWTLLKDYLKNEQARLKKVEENHYILTN